MPFICVVWLHFSRSSIWIRFEINKMDYYCKCIDWRLKTELSGIDNMEVYAEYSTISHTILSFCAGNASDI